MGILSLLPSIKVFSDPNSQESALEKEPSSPVIEDNRMY
jgi:hypothetical protein